MGRLIFTFSDLTTTLDIDFGLYYRLDSLTLRGSSGHLQICPVENNLQGNCEIKDNLDEYPYHYLTKNPNCSLLLAMTLAEEENQYERGAGNEHSTQLTE